ncbi:adhesion G-protein coupled receptor G7-like [Amphiura filiformis]|uniref:adhesion G-protein coupled receptor G7-like n=1 Tax=Amphiura filiformis TaxID=82378 RepID=UPI003B21202E
MNEVRLTNSGVQERTIFVRSSGESLVFVVDNENEDCDTYLVYSTSQLGTQYYVASYKPYATRFSSLLCISSIYPNTSINITTPAGETVQIILKRYESYLFDRNEGEDLSGTFVQSNKPIAVISGVITYVPDEKVCCLDGLIEQLPPVHSWGYTFTLTPFLSLNYGYVYRVFTTIHSATLIMSDGNITHIADESFYEEDVTGDTVVSFTSDQPVMAVQYMKGSHANMPDRGDPSMLIVAPNTAFTADVTFPVIEYTGGHTYYINVILECDYVMDDGVLLDGTHFTSSDSLSSSDNSMCCLRSNVSIGHHTVSHTNPTARFSVIVYAIGGESSYAYAANAYGAAEYLPTQPETESTTDVTAVTAPITNNYTCAGSNSSLAANEQTSINLEDIENFNVTSENVVEVVQVLAESTDRPDCIFTDTDIMLVGNALEKIANVGDGSQEVTQSVVKTVNNILRTANSNVPPTRQIRNNSTTRIILAVERQVAQALQQTDQVNVVESNIAVEGVRFNSSTYNFTGIGFGILTPVMTSFTNDSTRTYYEESSITQDGPTGYIFLSKDTVEELLTKYSDLTFVFVAYRNDFLFPSKKASKLDLSVEGFILSANVESDGKTVNLNDPADPVVIENKKDSESPTSFSRDSCHFPESSCVSWDFDLNGTGGAGDWSSEGCTYLGVNKDGRRVCHCNHLANFAMLVYHGENTINSRALNILSKVGCGLSVAALTITVTIFTLFRRLRTRPRNILIQLCVSLIALYLIFVVAIDHTCPRHACTVVAVLLHYFLLTTMAWMAVEARYLYIKLVRWYDPESDGFVIKSAVAAWGIPAAITAISLASFKSYQNEHYCFPKVGLVTHLGILLPIALVLIHNVICFVLVLRSIFRPRPGVGGRVRSESEKNEKKILTKRFQNTIAISCLLGLTWVFGFLAIDDAVIVFQWLFCIFNAFQGVFIFIIFCLKQKDVREVVTASFRSRCGRSTTTSGSRKDKSDTFHGSPSDATCDTPISSRKTTNMSVVEDTSGMDNKGIELDVQN